jgi:hypothetical protein
MQTLEELLKEHDWNYNYEANQHRVLVDAAMKTDPHATKLWEKYCPWSDTNGGYIQWKKNFN